MIVHNEEARTIAVHYLPKQLQEVDEDESEGKKGKAKKQKNIDPNEVNALAKKTLYYDIKPGCGEIPDEVWDSVKEDAVIKAMIEKETLKVLTDKAFETLPVKDAEKIAKLTYDEALLMKWRNAEKRLPILNAINDSLEELRKTKKKE